MTNRGLTRWLTGSRHGIEAYVYLGHRISGLILLLFVIAHILLSSSRLISLDLWAELMLMTRSPWLQACRYILFAAFAFHAFNGVRLILVELGFAVGAAEQQVYPYKGSISKQRPMLIIMMVLTGLLLVLGEFSPLRLVH